jgi:hypothetical protein
MMEAVVASEEACGCVELGGFSRRLAVSEPGSDGSVGGFASGDAGGGARCSGMVGGDADGGSAGGMGVDAAAASRGACGYAVMSGFWRRPPVSERGCGGGVCSGGASGGGTRCGGMVGGVADGGGTGGMGVRAAAASRGACGCAVVSGFWRRLAVSEQGCGGGVCSSGASSGGARCGGTVGGSGSGSGVGGGGGGALGVEVGGLGSWGLGRAEVRACVGGRSQRWRCGLCEGVGARVLSSCGACVGARGAGACGCASVA